MNKQNEVQQPIQNAAQIVYIVTRYNSIMGVYADLTDAQQIQATFIAKGQICDLTSQIVKPKNLA